MTSLRLRSLGHAEVLRDGQPVRWGAQSARDLVFLLLARPEGQTRDEIIDALWHEDAGGRSGNHLRVTLHRARTALGSPESIVERCGAYHLSDEVMRASDVFELYAALQQAEVSKGDARFFALGRAIETYTGDFLPHVQAEWVRAARESTAPCTRGRASSVPCCTARGCGASQGAKMQMTTSRAMISSPSSAPG